MIEHCWSYSIHRTSYAALVPASSGDTCWEANFNKYDRIWLGRHDELVLENTLSTGTIVGLEIAVF